MDLVTKLSPHFKTPFHLKPWVDTIESVTPAPNVIVPVHALNSVPVRHQKTETTLAGIVYMMLRTPWMQVILMSHDYERVKHLSKRLRALAEQTEIGPTKGYNEIATWMNKFGGGVTIMSSDQSRLGNNCHVLILDDPMNEDTVKDAALRDDADEKIAHYVARCRIPETERSAAGPGAVLGVASRLHVDDPFGRMIGRQVRKWSYWHQPGIVDLDQPTERAFAPEVWPLEDLKLERAAKAEQDPTEQWFWSQVQNEPRNLNATYFREPARYDVIPPWPGFRLGMGIDMSYSKEKRADFFALVVARFYGPKFYLLNSVRMRAEVSDMETALRAAQSVYGECPIWTYISGPEIAAVKLLRRSMFNVIAMHASAPKFVRAQPTIKRWNDANVLVPLHAPWVKPLLGRLAMFAGNERDPDDEADALVSLCDGASGRGGSLAQPRAVGAWTF
jgi:phage terminase large subunit-like protein